VRIKILNDILIISIVTVLLVIISILIPSNIVRIILGLPAMLLFPGYSFVAALYPGKEGTNNIQRLALSIGVSIAIITLIALILNYTPWGVGAESVLFSVSIFILLASAVALLRRNKVPGRNNYIYQIRMSWPVWAGGVLNKLLFVSFIISIIVTLGVVSYVAVSPRVEAAFTEFYILGLNGEAQAYPEVFSLESGDVARVEYGDGSYVFNEPGMVTLGIVSHEKQRASYYVLVNIDGEQISINYNGGVVSRIGPVELAEGEKWEKKIGFAPQYIGDNQKVEFLLFKEADSVPISSLHLRINAGSN
jgi:uncharacterized membrane protein